MRQGGEVRHSVCVEYNIKHRKALTDLPVLVWDKAFIAEELAGVESLQEAQVSKCPKIQCWGLCIRVSDGILTTLFWRRAFLRRVGQIYYILS